MDKNKLAKFIINEIGPRLKKGGAIPPLMVASLVQLEEEGTLTRVQTRKYLDENMFLHES